MGDDALDRKTKKLEDLEAYAFANAIMTGPCPGCGSENAHSCEYDPEDPDSGVIECEVPKAIDNPLIGHCESCGCLFCTECHDVIPGADSKPLNRLSAVIDTHEKKCPELKPRRWAEKYGSTYLLVSMKKNKAVVEHDDTFDLSDRGKRYSVKICGDCGMTPEEMAKHIGQYLKLDIDPINREISAATTKISSGEEFEDHESDASTDFPFQDGRTQVGISYYTGSEFSKAKSAGLFPGDDFENYTEWQKKHTEMVGKMAEIGYKVADIEVRVDEFLEWQKASKRYDRGAVSVYVAELLSRGQRILKWYNR